jgi:hypothetical protein
MGLICKTCNTVFEIDINFCPSCGNKLNKFSTNIIDQNFYKVQDSTNEFIDNVKNEFKESVVVEKVKHKSVELFYKIIKVLGILSIFNFCLQILHVLITNEKSIVEKSYDYCYYEDYNFDTISKLSCFFGRIIFPIILPAFFVILASRKNKLFLVFGLLLLISVLIM